MFTTLAPSEQEKAQAAVSQGLAELAQRGLPAGLQGALVLADTANGEVRALAVKVGSLDLGQIGRMSVADAHAKIKGVRLSRAAVAAARSP